MLVNLCNERVGYFKWFLISGRERVACPQGGRQVGDGFAKVLEIKKKE